MIKMHNTPPWVDSVRANFDLIAKYLFTEEAEITDAGAVETELDPDKIYEFTGAVTSLTITFSEETGHYHFSFLSGNPAATLTMPVDVVMPDGFSVEADKRYEVDVLNGYGTVMSWSIS